MNHTELLAAADEGRVRYRWIARNSGPDEHRWYIDCRPASLAESAALVTLYRNGMVGEAGDGYVRISVRARARLILRDIT